ncbi:hypothetical protein GOP47_0029879 [Adiantum capillus-veneris]|nr:hypothetical protein GOP47_0029879 [Adiantum capillus-veneris]
MEKGVVDCLVPLVSPRRDDGASSAAAGHAGREVTTEPSSLPAQGRRAQRRRRRSWKPSLDTIPEETLPLEEVLAQTMSTTEKPACYG